MEEYNRLEEEKSHKREKVFNWQTATYGKIRVDDDLHNFSSVEAEFPAIVINNAVAPQDELQCKSQVRTFVNDEIDFRISFDESDDEDYTIFFDKNSFSYKMISVNDLKTDSENDYEKVMPSIPSPEPAISCFDDLDFFTDFENKFPTIVYNDAQTSKSNLLTEPILNPQHIDEFDLKDKTSLSEYDEEEQNVLYFNDIFPFNIIRPDNLKSGKDNDDSKIDIILSFEDNEYTHGQLRKVGLQDMALPPREERYRFIRYKSLEYPDTDIADFEGRLARFHRREVHRVPVFNFGGLPDLMAEGLSGRMLMEHRDKAGVHQRRMSWWQFILALGLQTEEEMQTAGFGVYWAKSARQITDKGDMRDYWIGILSAGDFLSTAPLYTLIRDPILRLYHRLIACSIAGRSQAHEKVTVTDLFYLRGMDVGAVNVPCLMARYFRLFAAGRKNGAHISGGQFVARLAEHFGLLTAEILGGLTAWVAMRPERQPDAAAGALDDAEDAPIVDEGGQADLAPEQAPQQPPPPPPAHARTMPHRMSILEENMHEIRRGLTEQREVIDAMARNFSRFNTWVTTGLGRMMDKTGVDYTPYAQTYVSYQRRVRQRTGEASTSAAQQDLQQPDP
ncbi:hypothetical protein Tco_0080293 [Tanacetum coccineum]